MEYWWHNFKKVRCSVSVTDGSTEEIGGKRQRDYCILQGRGVTNLGDVVTFLRAEGVNDV